MVGTGFVESSLVLCPVLGGSNIQSPVVGEGCRRGTGDNGDRRLCLSLVRLVPLYTEGYYGPVSIRSSQ